MKEQTKPSNKPFDTVLRDIRYGGLLNDLTEACGEMVQACTSTGRAGQITMTLKFKPSNNGAVMEVVDDLKVKMPELSKGTSLFYPTPQGNLLKNDPRQPELTGLKDVSTPADAAPLKTIPDGDGVLKEVAA